MRQYALLMHFDEHTEIEPCVAPERGHALALAKDLAREKRRTAADFLGFEVKCLRSPGEEVLPVVIPGQMSMSALGVSFNETEE